MQDVRGELWQERQMLEGDWQKEILQAESIPYLGYRNRYVTERSRMPLNARFELSMPTGFEIKMS